MLADFSGGRRCSSNLLMSRAKDPRLHNRCTDICAAPHTLSEREPHELVAFGQIGGVEAFMAQMDRTFLAAMFGSVLPQKQAVKK